MVVSPAWGRTGLPARMSLPRFGASGIPAAAPDPNMANTRDIRNGNLSNHENILFYFAKNTSFTLL
jgi:hypothetical protein